MSSLKEKILEKQNELRELQEQLLLEENGREDILENTLSHREIARYSRQLILPELGIPGQLLLAKSKVLIVGCGGLGCPAAIYLAAAGVGQLGLLDYDDVEMSNLHRQVLHTEFGVNKSKSSSVGIATTSLNSDISVKLHKVIINSKNALDIVAEYDIVLDCTDNVATRYLINDACVLKNKVLVSGAALRWEGQLAVYNYKEGPCYRCMYASPPAPETVTNCSDGGVMGVIPGIIGTMQALETIKIITNIGQVCSMIIFDAFTLSFRKCKLRARQTDCAVCGDNPTVTKLVDYEQFCGAKAEDKDVGVKVLESTERITVREYKEMIEVGEPHLLIDVRQPVELGICSLPGAMNVPLKEMDTSSPVCKIEKIKARMESEGVSKVVCVCRRGNDSQLAVRTLKKNLSGCEVKDIFGGLTAWANKIDNSMPIY